MRPLRIPEHWTGHDALTVAQFLDQLTQAIWDTHGDAMAELLRNQHDADRLQQTAGDDPHGKLPF